MNSPIPDHPLTPARLQAAAYLLEYLVPCTPAAAEAHARISAALASRDLRRVERAMRAAAESPFRRHRLTRVTSGVATPDWRRWAQRWEANNDALVWSALGQQEAA